MARLRRHVHFVCFSFFIAVADLYMQFWEAKMPTALTDGKVELQVTNFFEAQPIKDASVYFMRLVLHDWPDSKCQDILKIVRAAAGSDSKLIVFDQIMTHTCKYDGPFAVESNPIQAPEPLLKNLGMGAGGFLTMIDMQVCFV
jgi:hypothetical protein